MLTTSEINYQSNHHFVVGHGPKTCAAIGCVECSCTMILRDLGVVPRDFTPEEFNTNAIADGAFDDPGLDGQTIDVPIALKRYPVKVEDKVTEGLPYERGRIFAASGQCLVRVAFTDNRAGDHTIAGATIAKDGSLTCYDPAIGFVTLRPNLTAENLGWGHDENGKPILRDYRVVNLRGIFRV